jgi:Protein of unknown function (DUF3034)
MTHSRHARAKPLLNPPVAHAGWMLGATSLLIGAALLMAPPARAGDRLLATWGVTQVEGAAGGGLTPWAVIAGTGSSDQVGGSAYTTRLRTQDGYELKAAGAAIGIRDRLEISMARWSFTLSDQVAPGKSVEMTSVGAKAKVLGDAVYDQDRWWPQVSVGIQYKSTDDKALARALGARATDDVDLYLTATKVWLGALGGKNVLANVTLRNTRANQFGLLGFGGADIGGRRWHPEVSLAVMLRDDLVLGGEYRAKPDALRQVPGFEEEDAWDLFMAWFPWRHASLTLAWVSLGNIATLKNQQGLYVSGQAAF